jgi:hypothetical protein
MYAPHSSDRSSRAGRALLVTGTAVLLGGGVVAQEVGGGSKGAVSGAAGGATSEGANSALECCDQALGTIVIAAFTDSYNQLVKVVRNYRPQTVKGGLGTGGALGVQGGTTAASVKN